MKLFEFISISIIPIIIFLIISYGLLEKKKVFNLFIDGVTDGVKVVYKIFPTLIGVFLAVGLLRSSGIVDLIVKLLMPLTNLLRIPCQIVPLMLIRPVSGGASIAVATDIMKQYGVDSKIGLIASTIMGSTETTLYIIAIYTNYIGIKKIRFVLKAALIADVIGMLISVVIWGFLS